MSDFRRKLFEWLDPDWLEEAGRFPVPGRHHGDLGHGGNDHDGDGGGHDSGDYDHDGGGDHGGCLGDQDGGDHEHGNGLGNHDGECVKDDNEVDEDSHLHCAPRCGWWGGKPQ